MFFFASCFKHPRVEKCQEGLIEWLLLCHELSLDIETRGSSSSFYFPFKDSVLKETTLTETTRHLDTRSKNWTEQIIPWPWGPPRPSPLSPPRQGAQWYHSSTHTHPAIQKPFLNSLSEVSCNKVLLSNSPSVLRLRNVIEIKKHNSDHKSEQIPERIHASWASPTSLCQGDNHGRLWIKVPIHGLRYG